MYSPLTFVAYLYNKFLKCLLGFLDVSKNHMEVALFYLPFNIFFVLHSPKGLLQLSSKVVKTKDEVLTERNE